MYDPKYKNYLANIPYLINHFIYEYDIGKANMNVLFYKGIISQEEYDFVKTFPREQRQVYFGMMQKDKAKAEALAEGLAEFRYKFITENNIDDNQILSVKNDALYLIDTIPKITKFGNVEFLRKNIYTSYYHIGKLEIYYFLDNINNKELIDIKGINDIKLLLHKNYMIDFLCSVLESAQTSTIGDSLNIVRAFHKKYVERALPIEFYRELNADSSYRISLKNGQQYLLNTVDENNIGYLNIGENLKIIMDLYSIISNIYFSQRQ